MDHNNNSPTVAAQIYRDKMRLTVTNIRPGFKEKSEQEARQETGTRLCQIFKKYM